MFNHYTFIAKVVYQSSSLIFLTAVLSATALGLIPVFQSIFFKKIIVVVENPINNFHSSLTTLLIYISVYIFILMLNDIILGCRTVVYRMAGLNLTYVMQSKIIEKLKNIKYYIFYKPSFQNLYSLVLKNCNSEPLNIVYSALFIVSMSINLISFVSILAFFNIWILLLLTLLFLPGFIIKFKIQKENIKVWEQQSQNNRCIGYYFGLMTEKNSIKELREYNLYDYFLKKRSEKFAKNISSWQVFSKKELKYTILSQAPSKFGVFSVFVWIIIKTLKNQCSISDLIFYGQIILSIQGMFNKLNDNLASHYTSMLFMNKFFEFMEIDETIKCGNKIPKKGQHILEFKNVWFKYYDNDIYTLKNWRSD